MSHIDIIIMLIIHNSVAINSNRLIKNYHILLGTDKFGTKQSNF